MGTIASITLRGGPLSEIDWNVELRKIEREFDGLPPEPTPEELRAQRALARRTQDDEDNRTAAVGVVARLAIVLALGAALANWPYNHACGAPLMGYLFSIAVLVGGGLWTTVCSWRQRMPRTHILSLVAILWALTLAAAEVLPRVGYANADPSRPPSWSCG